MKANEGINIVIPCPKRVVLYGAGKRGRELVPVLEKAGIEVAALVDADHNKIGTEISRSVVQAKEELYHYSDLAWCVTIADIALYNAIKEEMIQEYHFSNDNLYVYNALWFFGLYYGEKSIIQDIEIDGPPVRNMDGLYFGLTNGLVLGGIEERVKQLCCAMLVAGRTNVNIITDNKDNDFDIDERLIGHIKKINLLPDEKIVNVSLLVQLLAKNMPCTVVTNHPYDLLIAASLLKSRFSNQIRIISIISGSAEWIYDEYLKFPIRSDVYVGVSKDIESHMTMAGADNVTSMTVPFQCDEILKREYTLESDKPIRIGYAGRLDGFENSQKRMDLLFKVMELLKEKGIAFNLDIAGEGPAGSEMRQMVTKLQMEDAINFLGRLEKKEIPSFWKRQDIGINMADYEGRSISIAEMMGGGAVPLVTNTSGVKQDITDGENGFIVEIGDFVKAAEKIEYLYRHRELIKDMGTRAHTDIFPKSSMAEHLKFWDSLLLQ
jgi:glycosyltransferase involved in cell wall biosynthesis